MTKKEDIDDKLIQWDDIFSDLTIDARDLIKDIKDMINYIAVLAILLIAMGISAILIAVIRNQGPKYIAMSVIIFSITAGNASILLRKWLKLRIRYDKLSTIPDKLG